MDKIRIGRVVFWKTASKTMTGKAKKVMSSHAVIDSNGTEYIVRRDILSVEPIDKVAKMAVSYGATIKTAAVKTGMENIEGFDYEIDFETGKIKFKFIDGQGARKHNHGQAHKEIMDAFNGKDASVVAINPGLEDEPGVKIDPMADIGSLVPEVKQRIGPAGPKGPGNGPNKPPAPRPQPVDEEEVGPTRILAR